MIEWADIFNSTITFIKYTPELASPNKKSFVLGIKCSIISWTERNSLYLYNFQNGGVCSISVSSISWGLQNWVTVPILIYYRQNSDTLEWGCDILMRLCQSKVWTINGPGSASYGITNAIFWSSKLGTTWPPLLFRAETFLKANIHSCLWGDRNGAALTHAPNNFLTLLKNQTKSKEFLGPLLFLLRISSMVETLQPDLHEPSITVI